MELQAVLGGTWANPVIELSFPVAARHGATGEPLREWVKSLPGRRWEPSTKVWRITAIGPDPDQALSEAGFVLIGPDDQPTFASDLVAPVAVPRRGDPDGMWQVHPRLGGAGVAAAKLGPGAFWKAGEGVWIVHPSVLVDDGEVVDWIEADEAILAAAREPVPSDTTSLRFDGTLEGLRGVPVTDLNCVTATAATAMAGVGIESVFDLLYHLPRRYLDLSNPQTAASAPENEDAAIVGRVTKINLPTDRAGMLKATITDAAGTRVNCRWFNAGYIAKKLPHGAQVVIYGKVERWTSRSGYEGFGMTNPLVEPVESDSAGKIIGFYPQSGKHDLSTWTIYRAVSEAVSRLGPLADPVPADVLAEHGFLGRGAAFAAVHDPADLAQTQAGRDRLAFDELLRLQLVIATARAAAKAEHAYVHHESPQLVQRFIASLPYPLTGAQSRAFREIAADMAAETPMHRLLQGEVGSGKTAVAIGTLLTAVDAGHQAAFVAPTEILANQHHADIIERLAGFTKDDGQPLRVELLTNKVIGATKKAVLAGIADGSVDIVVGTHAVIADAVTFWSLSCVVLDEQHRFGVEQRQALRAKAAGRTPDTLYATATPIPRTAAMTVFGDLDVSVLDEMPPGRTPIHTEHHPFAGLNDKASQVWKRVRAEVEAGRQAFVVCPLVKESLTKQDAAATATATELSRGALAELRLGVVTGKDRPADRAATMAEFAKGNLDVLVATTVIEVGVNVPNATVMVVLGADKFGLAQLHQLRGRVGRGQHQGACFLVADPKTSSGRQRMEAMCATTDGFALAEMDLNIRGAGQVTSAVQSGTGRDLRVAKIMSDTELLAWARSAAGQIVAGDPRLARYPGLRAEVEAAVDADGRRWLLTA